ncbi:ribose-5-phosphate isomerase RpiA [Paenibacillus sp. sptzw28]|uniref:ribose-5-phosphate isomerase RpiA n=1 Tax=Paenibacillus sp. sptzw28 TaxID=715179 RepID=UPI001C6F499D|nr:ribose-5-phosphate isomerase RpiA [Paenibacillus sp. sptzw28]QYR20144.1 ribose-5-phosphate isomerase RpiA [Paenibacillus sp. sptzw28]
MKSKQIAAERAVELIKDGMTVGLGTGSTAYWAIQKIGELVKGGLSVQAVATSDKSEQLARQLEIPIIAFTDIDELDLTIDGADELDPDLNLIKGGGGALFREKIVASASRELVIIADESKAVEHLGAFPLPVEIARFGAEMTMRRLRKLGCTLRLRGAGDMPFVTDNGNYIADCSFASIEDPGTLHDRINRIVGVVENGLFIGMANQAVIGYENGTVKLLKRSSNQI